MPQPQSPAPSKKEFDIRVHLRDRHGNLVDENHYAYHIINGVQYFERPIGSGNLFEPNGEPCGRIIDRKRLEISAEAAHVEFAAPPTGSEMIAQELDAARSESEELRKEIAALRKERELQSQIKDLEQKVIAKEAKAGAAEAAPSKFAAHLKD